MKYKIIVPLLAVMGGGAEAAYPLIEIGNADPYSCDTVGDVIDRTHDYHTMYGNEFMIGGHTRSRSLINGADVKECALKPVAFVHQYDYDEANRSTTLRYHKYFHDVIVDDGGLSYFGRVLFVKYRYHNGNPVQLADDGRIVGLEILK